MGVQQQVNTLISTYKLPHKLKEKIDNYVDMLSNKLGELEELSPRNLDDHSLLGNVKFPINDISFKLKASFLFKPPELHTTGSYQYGCLVKNEANLFIIDLAVEIPKECWQRNDHLNYVYHRKRALYLAYIGLKLQSLTDLVSSVEYCLQNGDHLKPIIILTPAGKLQSYCRFGLFPFASQSKSFVFSKFSPEKCNIQSDLFDQTLNLQSSPNYNSTILKDLCLSYHNEILKNTLSDLPNAIDALVLLRIWLDKRGLKNSFAHVLTVFTYHLLKNNSINPNLSALQIFKCILQHIRDSSWESNGVFFSVENSSDEKTNVDDTLCIDYQKNFQVVFVELHSNLNLCHNISIDLFQRLKFDANITLNQLNEINVNVQSVLSSKIDFCLYFDYYINISTDCIKGNFLNNEPTFLDCGFNSLQVLCTKLINNVKNAVGDRVLLIQHKEFENFDSWNINTSPPIKSNVKFLTLGLLINDTKAYEAITKGPLANHPDAIAFRDLWKEKSEIRRFMNGDICEAVFWNAVSQQEKRSIVIEAIKYILNRNMQLKIKYISSTFGYVDNLLELNSIKFDDPSTRYQTGEEFMHLINQNMTALKKHLHSLSNLPFSVIDVIGVDPIFRSTEVFPPFSVNSKPKNVKSFCNTFDLEQSQFDDKLKYIKPIEIIVKIEADIKIVNDLDSFQNQKYLFCYELGKAMAKLHNIFVRPTSSFVDLYFNGYVFRIIIAINKEVSIHREMANKLKVVKAVENAEADEIEFRAQVLPAIASSLNTFGKENSSFATTCRIFKRWLSLQMLRHFYNDITLDLLVAYSYLYFDNHYPIPNSPVKGFIRVLKFLSEFDFAQNSIIFNFNQLFSIDKINDIKENFLKERQRLPVIFIATPYDRKLSHHTRASPNALIVFHTQKLTHSLLSNLTSSLNLFKMPILKDYLKPNFSMFDIIIQLDTKTVLNKFEAFDFPVGISIKRTLYSSEQKHVMPITGFNPAKIYLELLKKSFNNLALFFYDEFGGRKIGVLLRPEAIQTKPFKYSTVEGSMLANTSYSHSIDNVTLNIAALMEDFTILGEGLVQKVVLQSNKLLRTSN